MAKIYYLELWMIYLDNAATTYPKPEGVYRAVDHVLRNVGGNPGRASHRMALEASRIVFEAREAVADFIGAADSSRIVFTKNGTEAINIALKGLLRPPDHVVTTTFEHNAVANTMKSLAADGVSVTRVRPGPDGLIDPADIERAITEKTRMVSMVYASNLFGVIQPVEEVARICKSKKVLFMVDGAQVVGAIPVDVEALNIDILAATGHKALFGPQGTGFLYLREGIEPPSLISGGTGDEANVLELPERLEAGTMNTPGIGGLMAGISFIGEEGHALIREKEAALLSEIISGLGSIANVSMIGAIESVSRVGLVSFNIEGQSSEDVGVILDNEFSVMVRCGLHCAPEAHREAGTFPYGAVRVSPGYFNTFADIDEFIKAVKAIAGR
jgi:cysteine desulfurase family protein